MICSHPWRSSLCTWIWTQSVNKMMNKIKRFRWSNGGYRSSIKLYMDEPARLHSHFNFRYTLSLSPFTTYQHTNFVQKKHLILLKLGAFYHNFLQIHPRHVNWAPFSVMKIPRSLYQNLGKSTPNGRHREAYIHVPCQCGNIAPK